MSAAIADDGFSKLLGERRGSKERDAQVELEKHGTRWVVMGDVHEYFDERFTPEVAATVPGYDKHIREDSYMEFYVYAPDHGQARERLVNLCERLGVACDIDFVEPA